MAKPNERGKASKSSSTGGKASKSNTGGKTDKSSTGGRASESNTSGGRSNAPGESGMLRRGGSGRFQGGTSSLPRASVRPEPAMLRDSSVEYRVEVRTVAMAAELDETSRVVRRALYHMARKAFPSDAALAEAIGVHRSQVSRWKEGEAARPENAWLLRDLAFAVETLSEHLEESTIRAWLHGRSPELEGESPMESIRAGRLPDVLMAFQAQVGGAYH